MNDKNNDIGNVIKSFREIRHMSQSKLAEQLGVSQRNVSYYESGERTPPADVLKKLAAIFNITIDELVGVKKLNANGNCDYFMYEEGLVNWNIRKKSEELNLSYNDILDKTGINEDRFNLLWYGNVQPIAEELLRFSEVLNVSVDYLLDNAQRERISADEEIVLRYYKKYPEETLDLLSSFCNLNKRDRTIVLGKCFELEQIDSSVAADEQLREAK
jgi:transcriptional regulator with XRE-family HTH domain